MELACLKRSSPYLVKKKVDSFGVRFGKDFLIIPLRDTAGKLWSLQWIERDGTKRFFKVGGRKAVFIPSALWKTESPSSLWKATPRDRASIWRLIHQLSLPLMQGILILLWGRKESLPNRPLKIAGDDDVWNDTNTGRNSGSANSS